MSAATWVTARLRRTADTTEEDDDAILRRQALGNADCLLRLATVVAVFGLNLLPNKPARRVLLFRRQFDRIALAGAVSRGVPTHRSEHADFICA